MTFRISIATGLLLFTMLACKDVIETENKFNNSETIAVKTYPLKQSEGVVQISGTGIVTTQNEAKYSFKIGGVIDRIFVNENDVFKKGKLLATLKTEEIDAGYMQAKLGLDKAERDLKRIKNLYQDSVVTLEQFQNTQTAFDIAKKQLESVAFNRKYTSIYAEEAGFVTKKIANEGEIIGGGMPVFAINENNIEDWVLKVGLSDKNWASIEIGNKCIIYLDAYPDRKIYGIVSQKALSADQNSGSFQIEIKLQLGNLTPAIGMFGKAVIETNKIQKYQSIPYDALIEADGNNAFVFVPIPNGKVRRQSIEIESFDTNEVHVKSGLDGIQEVVLTNSAFLNENSSITIIK